MFEWIYWMFLELISYCANALLGVMTTDLEFWETSVPVVVTLYQIFVAVGWGLLIGNLAFQSMKAMFAGFGFETESPATLLLRTALFGTLLVFSRDICDIGLSIGKKVINLIGVPESILLNFPDSSFFEGIDVSWVLVIIIGFILGFQLIKLFFEIAERYVVVAVLSLLCPVGLALGGSKSTKDVCAGFIRTFASMIVMMVMNVLFLKLILSALATMPSGIMVLPWCLLVVGIARTARKIDNLISRIGLSPAFTGDPLTHGHGMMAAMMAFRTIKSSSSKIGKGKTGGGTSGGVSRNNATNAVMGHHPPGKTTVEGARVTNYENSNANIHTNSRNGQNFQNTQSSRFGNSNNAVKTQSVSSQRNSSNNYGDSRSVGEISSEAVHIGGTGAARINTNRFGNQHLGDNTKNLKTSQIGAVKPNRNPSAKTPGSDFGRKGQPGFQSTGKSSQGGLKMNENPFKKARDTSQHQVKMMPLSKATNHHPNLPKDRPVSQNFSDTKEQGREDLPNGK